MSSPAQKETRRTGRPPATSRAEILDAAWRFVERDGWQHLTVRRLAAQLGIGTTTLYHHIRDKQDLLVQLLDHYAKQQVPRAELTGDPRERIITAATTMHDGLATWPWVVEALTADDVFGESALWMVEAMVAGAVDAGCTPQQAVELYRHVWYYTAGEILVRTRAVRRRTESGTPSFSDDVFSTLDSDELPQLSAVGDRWHELSNRDTYPEGLRVLVDALLTRYTGS